MKTKKLENVRTPLRIVNAKLVDNNIVTTNPFFLDHENMKYALRTNYFWKTFD